MKMKIMAISIILILLSIIILPTAQAATDLAENELLQIKGKTITKTTTIEQINSMFGEPKIETENAFGGISCSYHDEAYSYYLYIETNRVGKIIGYGAIGGDFKAKRYAQGDKDDYYYWYLSGAVLTEDTDEVYGIMEYDYTQEDINTYWTNYKNNSSKYLYELQKHSIIVSHVLAVKNGRTFPQTFSNEDVFYMNEQLKYNGSNLYEYSKNSGKTQQISFIRESTKDFYSELPNPITLGGQTENYSRAENYQYILYDVEITDYEGSYPKGKFRILFIDPSFIDDRENVKLKDDEKEKLANAKAEYAKFKEKLDQVQQMSSYYDIEPQYEELPLVAGKYKDILLEATTDYLNIARAGLGIGTLTLNKDIADSAQHKAVLVYYNRSHGIESGHYPAQPEGVSDEFYNKAQSYMNENLYHGDLQVSVINALNDGYGDPVECGHRYNLLDPGYTEWGTGDAGKGLSINIQGCHKFSGYQSYDNELVAWPSNGITPIDMIGNGIGNWTARFYKNYSVTNNTTVTVKCLNTGKTYKITETSTADKKFLQTTGSRLVTFRDDSITYEDGDVFEITLHNIKDDASGNIIDYTYRSVFYKFSNSSLSSVTDIELNKSSVNITIGESERVLAKVNPEDASIKLMKFSSADEKIATVRQDGTITGVTVGTTTITVECEGITKEITVKVDNYLKGDINNDGVINMFDVNYGFIKLENGDISTDELERGDVTGDGIYNVFDINKVLIYLEGNIEKL